MRLLLVFLLLFAFLLPAPALAAPNATPPVETGVQPFLEDQPGPLKNYQAGDQSAADLIDGTSSYYGVSPRLLLALLEASNSLLSTPSVPPEALERPFGSAGPAGFAAQIDWATRELRAGYGPYERAPVVTFTDSTTQTISLDQAPEGVAVQRFLARGRSQAEWLQVYGRFLNAFQTYFNNELPSADTDTQAPATSGFLGLPWQAGTRVVHLAYFDHMYPTVDSGAAPNGYMVNYLGKGGVQYDGHDGHDFYFPDQPIGTLIVAAADGVAYARTHRGYGVVIIHPGGYETVYWHLDKFSRRFVGLLDSDRGVPVKSGDVIGSSGKTGFTSGTPHLHFEVRHNGKEVDPYGWYGPGDDPCTAYAACEASTWLWRDSLRGVFDLTPPPVAGADTTPPAASIHARVPDLLLLAEPAEQVLPQIGSGTPVVQSERLAYPTAENLRASVGTILMQVDLPENYPTRRGGRSYLLASSANPDDDPVYSNTLALRREPGPDGLPQWNFWTTPASGEAGRNDLRVPDTLGPGLHQFALRWDATTGTKALLIDGKLVASAQGQELPSAFGDLLDLGRFSPGNGASGASIRELAIFSRALTNAEVAAFAQNGVVLPESVVPVPQVVLDANAADDAGGIVRVQIGVDGVFGDPQPYESSYTVALPQRSGSYDISARFFDRAGNSTTATTRVIYTPPDIFFPFVSKN